MHPCVHVQGTVSNMLEEGVVQPLLVTTSALNLATECVRMILKVPNSSLLPESGPLLRSFGECTCCMAATRVVLLGCTFLRCSS
jgi:hypothetical protein